ncbi:hypothetical protein [Paenibacillus sp. YIM B09110]|uniref:hypothetical protein n=1 Tax=Paenibacillus sp. YIM B09110 TaxID=3126102 RepID=UPI00301D7831
MPEVIETVDEVRPAMPDRISLAFQPLELIELPSTETAPGWKEIKSIPFGSLEGKPFQLDVYEELKSDESLFTIYNGILKVGDQTYLIREISQSITESGLSHCTELCVIQKLFSGQERYELIGSVPLFANGPGRNLFVVFDRTESTLLSFEGWGAGNFMDLDADGMEEFIIEFPGLHMSWPDLTVIRAKDEGLEISSSVVDAFGRKPGDFATLNKDQSPPRIRVGNIADENLSYDYEYINGVLQAVGG